MPYKLLTMIIIIILYYIMYTFAENLHVSLSKALVSTRKKHLTMKTLLLVFVNKKLSYRRETARQLPTWRGLSPPVHSPSPLWLHVYRVVQKSGTPVLILR